MEEFSLRTVVLNSSQLNQQSYCRDVSRWWSSADPRTHTWSTWTLSACSPAWVCGCYSGCLGLCCWSEGSYLQPISSGWSPVAPRLSEILPTVGAIKLQIKGAKHERGDSSLKCGWSGSTFFYELEFCIYLGNGARRDIFGAVCWVVPCWDQFVCSRGEVMGSHKYQSHYLMGGMQSWVTPVIK